MTQIKLLIKNKYKKSKKNIRISLSITGYPNSPYRAVKTHSNFPACQYVLSTVFNILSSQLATNSSSAQSLPFSPFQLFNLKIRFHVRVDPIGSTILIQFNMDRFIAGKYKLGRKIGSGSFGEIHLGMCVFVCVLVCVVCVFDELCVCDVQLLISILERSLR